MSKIFITVILTLGWLGCFIGVASAELTKEIAINRIEVLENGCVQVRQAIRVLEDGKIISQQFHRYLVSPGDDYSKHEDEVRAVCEKVQTQAVIDAYKNPTTPEVAIGLVKQTKVNKVYVLEDGTLMAEKVTRVLDSGKEIGQSKVVEKVVPGADVTASDKVVKDIAEVIHTKEVVDAYKAKQAIKEAIK